MSGAEVVFVVVLLLLLLVNVGILVLAYRARRRIEDAHDGVVAVQQLTLFIEAETRTMRHALKDQQASLDAVLRLDIEAAKKNLDDHRDHPERKEEHAHG